MEPEELAANIQTHLLRAQGALTEQQIRNSFEDLEGAGSLRTYLNGQSLTSFLQNNSKLFVRDGGRWRSAATNAFDTILTSENDSKKGGKAGKGRGAPRKGTGCLPARGRIRGSSFLVAPRGGNRGTYGAAFRPPPPPPPSSNGGITSRGGGDNGFGRRPCPPVKPIVPLMDNNRNWEIEKDNNWNDDPLPEYKPPPYQPPPRSPTPPPPPRRSPEFSRRTPSPEFASFQKEPRGFSPPPVSRRPDFDRYSPREQPPSRRRSPSPYQKKYSPEPPRRPRAPSPPPSAAPSPSYNYPYRSFEEAEPLSRASTSRYRFQRAVRILPGDKEKKISELSDRIGAMKGVTEEFQSSLDRLALYSDRSREVEITRFRSFRAFSLRFTDELPDFKKMDGAIQRNAVDLEPALPIEVWSIKDGCLYKDKKRWKRAVVQSVESKMLRLLLIDIGMTVMADPSDVIPMAPQFSRIPPFALQCTLAATTEQLEELEFEEKSWAKRLMENRFRPSYITPNTRFDCQRDGRTVLGVDLFVTILDEPSNILECRI